MTNRTGNRGAMRVLVALAALGLMITSGCDERENSKDQAGNASQKTSANANNQGAQAFKTGQSTREGDNVHFTLAFPTGQKSNSSLLLEKIAPAQVHVGQPYSYQIRVTNLTNEPLAGVTVSESFLGAVRVESSNPPAQTQETGQQPQSADAQQASAQRPGDHNPEQQAGAQDQQQSKAGHPSTQPSTMAGAIVARWYLPELMPKQAQTIEVMAVPASEGPIRSCLTAQYEPTLCTQITATRPNLALTKTQVFKTSGQAGYLCDTFTYEYTVKNTGTGVAKNVVVKDQLPEGVHTQEGAKMVSFNAGDLPAGQSKSFKAELKADHAGTFASRATADSAGDKAWSDKVTTRVEEASLAAAVNGPDWVYTGQAANFTIRVTNNGKIQARNVNLALQAPGLAQQDQNRQIGNLDPGQSRNVQITLHPQGTQAVKVAATATSTCAKGDNAAHAQATLQIKTVPALMIEMRDNLDPVAVGSNTTYQIVVQNQGTAPAKDVTLSGDLAPQLAFVSGSGQTNVTGSGQKVNFAAIPTLAPGQAVSWKVVAKGQKQGDGNFRVELAASNVSQHGLSVEPTTVVAASSNGNNPQGNQ